MRSLLFLSHRVPYPPDKGEKIRAYHVLRHLARDWRVHLGCLADGPAERAAAEGLGGLCAEIACFETSPGRQRLAALVNARPGRPLTGGYFHDPRLAGWVTATLARTQIDLAYAYSSGVAPYLARRSGARILDMVDVDSAKWAAYARDASQPRRALWAREARTLLAYEREAARRFGRTLFVSEAERAHFLALAPEAAGLTDYVENGVDLARHAPGLDLPSPYPPGVPALVFTGTMDYRPNVEAVSWFATAVLPRLAHRRPALEFHIVGARPAAAVRRLAALPGVHVTGQVPDTRPYVLHADAVVAPLTIARGIQNKVLEAMALGRPVIASPQALEGVRAAAGRDLLVADGAAATAARVGEVLDGRHPGLGGAARQAMERAYDWSATLARLDRVIDGLAA